MRHYVSGSGGGGGAGSGGNGGLSDIFYNTLINLGTITATGGTSGTGGTSSGYSYLSVFWYAGGGNGGNGIYGAGGIPVTYGPGSNGNIPGGGGGGGGALAESYGGPNCSSNGGNGAAGKTGRSYTANILSLEGKTTQWIENVNGDNFINIWNMRNTDGHKTCIELDYKASGNCQVYQIVDFASDVSGIKFRVGASIKISTLAANGSAKLSFQYLKSNNDVISTVTIATFSAVQKYKISELLSQTAPALTQKIKLIFECTGAGNVIAYLDNAFVIKEEKYGIKVIDPSGDSLVLTPSIGNIISAGTITMPAGLNVDNTYGSDIDLPGTDAIAKENIEVFVQATKINFQARIYDWDWTGAPWNSTRIFNWYGDSTQT